MRTAVINAHPAWIAPLSQALRDAGLTVYPSELDHQIVVIYRGPCDECDRLACAKIIIRKLAAPAQRQEWYEVVITMPDGSQQEFEEYSPTPEDICHLIISYLVGYYQRDDLVEVRAGLPRSVLVVHDVHVSVWFSQIK